MALRHWLLFSRVPRLGETKTRLAATVGAEAAREFHVHCLNDLLAEGVRWKSLVEPTGAAVHLHLFVTPPVGAAAFAEAGVSLPPGIAVHPQQGPHLGARMHHALAQVLEDGGAEPAVALLTGTDLPLLRAEHLLEAEEALTAADVVFGPTEDGGYYLVGLRKPCPALFRLAQWGEGGVLTASLRIAREEGLRVKLIRTLPDGDTLPDLRRIAEHPLAATAPRRAALRFIRRILGREPTGA